MTSAGARLLALGLPLLLGAADLKPSVRLWRLDCGSFDAKDYDGRGPAHMANGCYLIRHRDTYMLWDAGLTDELVGHPEISPEQTVALNEALIPQLVRLGVRPADIRLLGISHFHGDHVGQAKRFPGAKLLIGAADFAVLKASKERGANVAPWIEGKAQVEEVTGDRDVFGDGSVVMIATPGHTPGHHSLLVRTDGGNLLLSGDAVHFRDQLASGKVPGNATNLDEARQSLERLKSVAAETQATIIVQHDPIDTGSLPQPPAGVPGS